MHRRPFVCMRLVLGLASSSCVPDAADPGGDALGSSTTEAADAPPGTSADPHSTSSTTASIGNDDATTDTSTGGEVTSTSESTTGETMGAGSSTGEPGSSSGTAGEDVVCPDPSAGIAWAGDWGKRLSHACTYSLGLPEPFVVNANGFGHDCYIVTAEVWIPGITDVDGNQNLIRTESLLEDPTGAVEVPNGSLVFEGRFGNNYRYSVSTAGGWWSYAPFGSYDVRFRFSYLDDNIGCWYTIGLGDGPDGGAPRTLELMP